MANLYGYSCGECSNVYQARAWEPTCPRCQSADTIQISVVPVCYCPLDCRCRRVHDGRDTFAPCGCQGDGSIAATQQAAYCVRCKSTWSRPSDQYTDYCPACRDVLVANTKRANAYAVETTVLKAERCQ